MKHILIFCLIACFYGINAKDDEMRFIRFNETYAKWMPLKEVEDMVEECAGKPGHTGFMDMTANPDFVPIPQRKVFIPGGPTHQAVVNRQKQRVNIQNVWSTITTLSAYTTRYYTIQSGADAVNWLASEYRRIAGDRLGDDIHVYTWGHSWLQPSLIVEITGTVHPTQRVVIGGHIDSTAGAAGNRAPGADDDASGSSTILEIFRVLVADGFKPERTIEFQAYAAEEVGLRGSQEIAKYYSDFNYNVIGMMQLDMTGYDGSSAIGLVTDYTNPVLTSFLRQCLGAYCTIPVVETRCNYGCSDHASWYNYGFPSAFTFESAFSSSNPYIHTASDTIANLSPEHAVQFVYAGLGFCTELSYRED